MTDELLDAIRKDREAGTRGDWKYVESASYDGQEYFGCGVVIDDVEQVWLEGDCADADIAIARRIARVPDLEARLLSDAERIAALEAECERMRHQTPPAITDAECAERLLNRHARLVAASVDAGNLRAAEDLMAMPVKRLCELVVRRDAVQGDRDDA